jgi:hypothetical protein
MSDDLFTHSAIIALCLLVLLGLSTTQIDVAWNRMKEFLGKFIEDDPYDSKE